MSFFDNYEDLDDWNVSDIKIDELVGKTIKSIEGLEKNSTEVLIKTECGNDYLFYHCQDCCEQVDLEDFEVGSNDMTGALIISAEEVSESGDEESHNKPSEYCESFTWTFYKIETTKGEIFMRWLGTSNGYYGEEVSIGWLNKPKTAT